MNRKPTLPELKIFSYPFKKIKILRILENREYFIRLISETIIFMMYHLYALILILDKTYDILFIYERIARIDSHFPKKMGWSGALLTYFF